MTYNITKIALGGSGVLTYLVGCVVWLGCRAELRSLAGLHHYRSLALMRYNVVRRCFRPS